MKEIAMKRHIDFQATPACLTVCSGPKAYSIPYMNISYGVFSVCSSEKLPREFLDTLLAFVTGHAGSPFSASDSL